MADINGVEAGLPFGVLIGAILLTVLADCHFPWDDDQARMERSLKEPLPFERRGNTIMLHVEESASTLLATPYVG
ncbi:hypothetical protein [Arthrobacter sp.]|uniref:hypothetical protein n=1 Tax=Arthrobacter sp. TaxID=1667 RepID=UPI00281235EE|nr:hypothetical protein [Arthrobacter sp.]